MLRIRCFSLLAVALMMAFLPMRSLASVYELIVYDGEYIVFDCWLTDSPIISFNEVGVSVRSNECETFLDNTSQKPYSRRLRFEIVENTDGNLSDIEDADMPFLQTFQFRYIDRQTVAIGGLHEGSSVEVFAVDGKKVYSATSYSNEWVRIDIGQLPKGYYVIKTEQQSFKISKR